MLVNRIKWMALVMGLLGAGDAAFAGPYVIACGAGRSEGFARAEVALVDDPESFVQFYLNGSSVPLEEFDLATGRDSWIITLYGGNGGHDRKFLFDVKKESVQEFLLIDEKTEKKNGDPRPCRIQD